MLYLCTIIIITKVYALYFKKNSGAKIKVMKIKITEGEYKCEGGGVVSCKLYNENGFWVGNRTYSNGAAYDSQPSGTLLSENFREAKGVYMLTDCGYRHVPEYEVYEKGTDFEKEVRDLEDFAFSIIPDLEFENWLNLFRNESTNELALQILRGYNTPITITKHKTINGKRR